LQFNLLNPGGPEQIPNIQAEDDHSGAYKKCGNKREDRTINRYWN
jgi:hypothetical protein